MRNINVLAIQRISADNRAKIEASDPAIQLIDAGGWFEGEIRETWSDFAASRSTNAAWRIQHKLMQAMMERDRRYKLGAAGPRIEIDDVYIGGERTGEGARRGRRGSVNLGGAWRAD